MFKCENCGKDHDGSYGSGRFCSDHCRRSYSGKRVNINGQHKCNFPKRASSPYGTWKCPYCANLICKTRKVLQNHLHQVHPDHFSRHVWNKGLTKETDNRVRKAGNTYSARVKAGLIIPSFLGKHHTEASKRLLSKVTGGYREGSSRSKHGWYHGIWCDSSWELAWVIYQEDHCIQFKRYTGYFEYEFNGKKHRYYPDFQLEDGTLIEIKGYMSDIWKAKLVQVPKTVLLQVLYKKEMKPILDYVKSKYGKDFIQLYEI